MDRVLAAWDNHATFPNLPALLPERLRAHGFQVTRQLPIPIINAVYSDSSFSRWLAPMVKGYVIGQGVLPQEVVEEWANEFADLDQRGAYWFCSTPVLTEAVKAS